MIVVLTGTTFVCLVVFGLFTLIRAYYAVVDSEVARLSLLADARTSEVEALTEGYEQSATLMAGRERLQELLAQHTSQPDPETAAALTRILRDAAATDDALESISVIDATGMVAASTDPALVGDLAGGAAGEPGPAPEAAGGELNVVVDASSIHLVAVAPVTSAGEHVGVVQMYYAPIALTSLVQQAGFDRTGEVVVGLRDAGGGIWIVASSGEPGVAVELADPDDAGRPVLRALTGDSVTLTDDVVDYDGVEVIAVTRALRDENWGLVVKIDQDEVVARMWSTWVAFQVLTIGFLVFGVVAGLLTGGRIEKELASRVRAETRFSSLFASAPSAMLLVGTDGRAELANQRASDLLGYDPETLRGMEVDALVPGFARARRELLLAGFDGDAHPGQVTPGRDLVARAGDGRGIQVEVSLTPVETDDGSMVLVALVDLTERKRTEGLLEERADALARSNQDLDSFAYVASHDLKAPLRAMEQLAGFVLEDAGDALPEQSRKDLEQVQLRSQRLMGLLNGLLQYSRIGRREGGPSLVETGEVLAELVELYVPGDRFRVEIADDLPVIHAPRPAVELVFRNLLMNAVKHHDRPQGNIWIRCRPEGRYLLFTVADDGPGIPASHREKVFELFQTVRGPGVEEGSGMGLALVKRTVEIQGGTVALSGNEGRGATFEIRLPRRPIPEAQPAEQERDQAASREPKEDVYV
jgi:PAS domain S-box-containing protein